jgi:hypothetical protein
MKAKGDRESFCTRKNVNLADALLCQPSMQCGAARLPHSLALTNCAWLSPTADFL